MKTPKPKEAYQKLEADCGKMRAKIASPMAMILCHGIGPRSLGLGVLMPILVG